MKKVYLSLGTNLGDRAKNLSIVKVHISSIIGKIVAESKIYETKPWGITNQPDFLNQVILVSTNLNPFDVLNKALDIELQMGRKRISKWYSRIIDIDVLFYEGLILNSEQLTIPHHMISNRNFVLIPLLDLAPEYIHPVSKKSIKE